MDCPIHLERIATEHAAALPCGHVFCLSCITKCFNAVKRDRYPCPVCKKPASQKQVLRLFLQASSPSSSPTKSRAPGQLSATEHDSTQALRNTLENLSADASSKEVERISADMQRAADSISITSMDIEAKCLAEEIKSAAARFQDLLLPALQELESVRLRVSDLEKETAGLKAILRQKEHNISANHRTINALEKNSLNLQMVKRIAEDNASRFRETLTVTSEKLKDAQDSVRTKDETIGKQDESLAQYRKWLADHKLKGEKYKLKIKELETLLNERPSHEPLAGSSRRTRDSVVDFSNDDQEEDTQPSSKRRRVEREDLRDVKLDRSCFMTKPTPSFRIPEKKAPEPRAEGRNSALPGLNLTKGGQVKGLVTLGSRQRLGKLG